MPVLKLSPEQRSVTHVQMEPAVSHWWDGPEASLYCADQSVWSCLSLSLHKRCSRCFIISVTLYCTLQCVSVSLVLESPELHTLLQMLGDLLGLLQELAHFDLPFSHTLYLKRFADLWSSVFLCQFFIRPNSDFFWCSFVRKQSSMCPDSHVSKLCPGHSSEIRAWLEGNGSEYYW